MSKNIGKEILVVVDMQKDFIDGSLGTKEAQAIVPRVLNVIKQYQPEDIYATRDTHQEDYLETQEGKYLPVPHCLKDSDGWQFDQALAGLEQAHIVDKPSFGSCKLVELLKERAKKEPLRITMVGLCTDICVVSNALLLKAALPETSIIVYEDCCAGVTPETHAAAITTMKMCQIKMEQS